MTQIAAVAAAARPALTRLGGQLVSRLALALLLAYLAVIVPGAARAGIKGGPVEGFQAVYTLSSWLVQGFWNAIIGG